jgi:hypothetical protein
MTSGKWYWEVNMGLKDAAAGQWYQVGIIAYAHPWPATSGIGLLNGGYAYYNDGQKGNNGAFSAYGATFASGDVLGVAFDADAGTLTFYKNGTSQGQAYSGIIGSVGYVPAFEFYRSAGTAQYMYPNFGQRPFAYTPPPGFKALCTANLPAVTIANPRKHFDVHTRTGTGTTANITGKLLSPDLVWIKNRGAAGSSHIADSLRGVANQLFSDATLAEASRPLSLTALNSDGYSLGNGSDGNVNTNTNTYVDWLWKANGAGVSNTDGSITSTVSANQVAGFSIVTFSGAGSAGTIGHGLGVTPGMLIFKSRDNVGTTGWNIWHKSLTSSTHYLTFTTAAQSNSASNFSGTWNSSVFGLTTTPLTIGADLVAYCFAEIPGYSKIGSYTGNGSADGPFVWCGFRPKFILLKDVTTGGTSWITLDAVRDSFNVAQNYLAPNVTNAEGASSALDITASGFKLRASSTPWNANNATHVFIAFAEHPFGGSNVSPAPAR